MYAWKNKKEPAERYIRRVQLLRKEAERFAEEGIAGIGSFSWGLTQAGLMAQFAFGRKGSIPPYLNTFERQLRLATQKLEETRFHRTSA